VGPGDPETNAVAVSIYFQYLQYSKCTCDNTAVHCFYPRESRWAGTRKKFAQSLPIRCQMSITFLRSLWPPYPCLVVGYGNLRTSLILQWHLGKQTTLIHDLLFLPISTIESGVFTLECTHPAKREQPRYEWRCEFCCCQYLQRSWIKLVRPLSTVE